ncbi:hypothetical protein PVAR5_8370 [Paecilomyces variotii No. 5]|uniref:Uncharacterized protein n=1 Tax=Byssochlamys spectabilis (strain No. 5 / NBRC 109023) TaxID=1356009 RepID=V5G5A5_BYSSN|nr:hypothetical protein PVAR5_8370 [Paecilomyces variotii No. 5]
MSTSSPQDDQTKHRSVAELPSSLSIALQTNQPCSFAAALPRVDASVRVSDGMCTVCRPVAELIGLVAPSSYSVPGSIALAPSLESFPDGGELGRSLCAALSSKLQGLLGLPEIRPGRAG